MRRHLVELAEAAVVVAVVRELLLEAHHRGRLEAQLEAVQALATAPNLYSGREMAMAVVLTRSATK